MQLRTFIVTTILGLTLFDPTALTAQTPKTSYDTNNTIQIARTLLHDQHYPEAVSLIRQRLDTQPEYESRLELLLLLADGLMGLGDLKGAEVVIQEAGTLVVSSPQEKAVDKRHESLLDLLFLGSPPAAEDAGDTLIAAADVLEEAQVWPLVTNSFFETDLRQVLIDLSMETEIPILWDATVQGLVTYEAIDQPLENVLKAILFPAGYTFSYKDGAYYVGSPRPEDPAFGFLSKTEKIVLSNIDATEAIALLSDYFKPYVKASATTNMVCITAPPTMIDRIKEDLISLDEPPEQILIEVIFTEISTSALRELGLDWSVTGVRENPLWDVNIDNSDIDNPGVLYNYSEMSAQIGEYTMDLVASLEAMVQTGDAHIRANPRITTLNGRTAEISLIRDQYFIIQTGSQQYYSYNSLQSVSTGIKLEITPYTSESGEITVFIKPEVGDVVGESGADNLPEISTRAASTSVRVMDGQTFTIGGLSLQLEKNVQKKIPLLGDIPILGYLFRYDKLETRDTEIIIFVTPHILGS
jgi:type IV pilus assembly protein PilQ